jgi:Xaa-Pro dipeptidase
MSHVESRFAEHLETTLRRLAESLTELGVSELILGAGRSQHYYSDDQEIAFHTDPAFAWLCPQRGPGHLLKVVPGKKPKLIRVEPKTFWVERAAAPEAWWADSFEIVTVETPHEAWKQVEPAPRCEFVGSDTRFANLDGVSANRELVQNALDWWRNAKTPYEVECIAAANISAAKGHRAARDAFLAGASEFEAYIALLSAVGQSECQLSFPPILASNEKAAILHYESRRHIRNQGLLLVDSGTFYNGYASDVSRTWVQGSAHPLMRALVQQLNTAQQAICRLLVVGKQYAEVQFEAFKAVARILEEAQILKVGGDYDKAVCEGIVQTFLPHGLGHGLGIVPHDVGELLETRLGLPTKPFAKFEKWRKTRPLEAGNVVTVEPGIYFNQMLLEKAKAGKHADCYNFPLAEELLPWGGIRIEDDVVVTLNGPRNLTREVLPE